VVVGAKRLFIRYCSRPPGAFDGVFTLDIGHRVAVNRFGEATQTKDVSMVGMSEAVSAKNPRPRGRLMSGFGGLGGRRTWAKPAVAAAALTVIGLLVAGPTQDAQAATSSVNPTGSTGPSGQAVPIGDLPAPSGAWHQTRIRD
jgi:hypothetical protein